jgi:hypothetical protein
MTNANPHGSYYEPFVRSKRAFDLVKVRGFFVREDASCGKCVHRS